MRALTTLENRIHAVWNDLTEDTRADLEQGLAELKAEVAKVKPVVAGAVADIKTAVAAAEPGIKQTVEQTAEKLVADLAKIGIADLGA